MGGSIQNMGIKRVLCTLGLGIRERMGNGGIKIGRDGSRSENVVREGRRNFRGEKYSCILG